MATETAMSAICVQKTGASAPEVSIATTSVPSPPKYPLVEQVAGVEVQVDEHEHGQHLGEVGHMPLVEGEVARAAQRQAHDEHERGAAVRARRPRTTGP